jgi:hypothetical protein
MTELQCPQGHALAFVQKMDTGGVYYFCYVCREGFTQEKDQALRGR